ncbi:ADP-ribosylglycohydrolase family protein [Flavobacteriaceae bacterium R38]|nr:ADP-ribosylglycohydrolase family protein [Flavobacteriaceae bacterium R38]
MKKILLFLLIFSTFSCKKTGGKTEVNSIPDTKLNSKKDISVLPDIIISRETYADKLYGFWLGQCIANWTGLTTEMDKIGNIGKIKTGDFYTRNDWKKPDQPSIWGEGAHKELSPVIDFVLKGKNEVWGADDDTDIEYMYQHLLYTNKTSFLTPQQIRSGWLKHIKTEEENYLWVSNQQAFDLMRDGILPPQTSHPEKNPHFEMIDAQLTTEIFGLFAPTRPDIAIKMAYLPIRTSARKDAAWISEFYIIMHALAAKINKKHPIKPQLFSIADIARKRLPNTSYAGKMYDFVKKKYESDIPWEQTRDSIYVKYQVNQEDGYDMTSRNLYCNGCFAGGINYAASLVSLFYGEGDFRETIKIGTLAGWDADNPTSTWGGLLGFIIGKEGIGKIFGENLSNTFNIHRTRQNFPQGIDSFEKMAAKGLLIIDKVVKEEMNGNIDLESNNWRIPHQTFSIHPPID